MLANLFLHYVFDCWMDRNWPDVPFCRYADDAVCHCCSEDQARRLIETLELRFGECGLTLHPDKTRIVYCQDDRRRKCHTERSFDFLGYTFRGRPTRDRQGELFVGFNPAVSQKSLKAMSATVRSWRLHLRMHWTLEQMAEAINPVVRGWLRYYGHYNVGRLHRLFAQLEVRLARWFRRKYKSLGRSLRKAYALLRKIRGARPQLFAHWQSLYTGRMAR